MSIEALYSSKIKEFYTAIQFLRVTKDINSLSPDVKAELKFLASRITTYKITDQEEEAIFTAEEEQSEMLNTLKYKYVGFGNYELIKSFIGLVNQNIPHWKAYVAEHPEIEKTSIFVSKIQSANTNSSRELHDLCDFLNEQVSSIRQDPSKPNEAFILNSSKSKLSQSTSKSAIKMALAERKAASTLRSSEMKFPKINEKKKIAVIPFIKSPLKTSNLTDDQLMPNLLKVHEYEEQKRRGGVAKAKMTIDHKFLNDLQLTMNRLFTKHNLEFDGDPEKILQESMKDLNVSLFMSYFNSKLKIVESALNKFCEVKKMLSQEETKLLENIFEYQSFLLNMLTKLSLKLHSKLRKEKNRTKSFENSISSFVSAIEALIVLKDLKNYDENLFGSSLPPEQHFVEILNSGKQEMYKASHKQGKLLYDLINKVEIVLKDKNFRLENVYGHAKMLQEANEAIEEKINEANKRSSEDSDRYAQKYTEMEKKLKESSSKTEEAIQIYKQRLISVEAELETYKLKGDISHREAGLSPIKGMSGLYSPSKSPRRYLDPNTLNSFSSAISPVNVPKTSIGIQVLIENNQTNVWNQKADKSESTLKELKQLVISRMMYACVDDYKHGYSQKPEWAIQIISIVSVDKYFADIDDIKEGRPCKSLREYLIEWFLSKFGIKKYAKVLLQDFIRTLVENQTRERFYLFLQLLGIFFESTALTNSSQKQSNNIALFLTSPEIHFYIIKLIFKLRCNITPYLPIESYSAGESNLNFDQMGIMISLDKIKNYLIGLLKDLKVQNINEIEIEKNMSQYYMGLRKVNKMDDFIKCKLNFDEMLKYISYELAKTRMFENESVRLSLRNINTGTTYAITYDEYLSAIRKNQSSRSDRWIEESFAYLYESKEKDMTNANEALLRLIPWLNDSFSSKTFAFDQSMLEGPKVEPGRFKTTRSSRDPISNIFLLHTSLKVLDPLIQPIENQKSELAKGIQQLKKDVGIIVNACVNGEISYNTDTYSELWHKFRVILTNISRIAEENQDENKKK